MAKLLSRKFFERPVVQVARELVGCLLVRRMPDGSLLRSTITETEAYDGEDDLASHASKGRTKRTEVMYGPVGRWYVYFTYGVHWMLNVVTGAKGYPSAVLIRGIEHAEGPGRLTKALKIDGSFYGKKAAKASDLWIEARPEDWRGKIEKSVRIGIDYAGPIWTKKEWRFNLRSPLTPSRRRPPSRRPGPRSRPA